MTRVAYVQEVQSLQLLEIELGLSCASYVPLTGIPKNKLDEMYKTCMKLFIGIILIEHHPSSLVLGMTPTSSIQTIYRRHET